LLVIAGVCGAVGQAIAGYSRGGLLAAVGVGFIGALVGTWVARLLNLPEIFAIKLGNTAFPIIWSIAGSTLFVALIALVARGRSSSTRTFGARHRSTWLGSALAPRGRPGTHQGGLRLEGQDARVPRVAQHKL
jgi:uncharacterized membrane protein YeaQ/YmgE (transglycosylase-associated protein family)